MPTASIYHDGTTIETFIEGYGLVNSIQTVSWAASNDRSKVIGTGQKHIGFTPGVISVDNASMEMTSSEFNRILQSSGGNISILMNRVFDITITQTVLGFPPIIVVLRDCSIINANASWAYGDSSPATVSVDLMVMGIDASPAPVWSTVNVPVG